MRRWTRQLRKKIQKQIMVPKKLLNFILFTFTIGVTSLWISTSFNNNRHSNSTPKPFKMLQKLEILNNPILMDLQDFRYILNNYPCLNNDIFLITIIHSAPQNLQKRNIIRTSWGLPKDICGKRLSYVFLLAKISNSSVQDQIEKENLLYGDLIQGNFDEGYKNLTYKNIMGMKWVSEYCPFVKFVLKTDDDIYVDIFRLFNLLQNDFRNKTSGFIGCNQWVDMPVVRSPSSKWYISKEQYAEEVYSPYCCGCAYVMTQDVASKLYDISGQFNYLFVDDFLVTGLMIDRAGYNRTKLNYLYSRFIVGREMIDWSESNDTTPSKYMVSSYGNNFEVAMKLWSKTVLAWTPFFKEMCANKFN